MPARTFIKWDVKRNKQQLMPENWKTYIVSDFIDINPKVLLRKGEEYSFVEMKDLDPNNKYVSPSVFKKLKGGARFQNGDTLFARITPCLENGKICQVKNLENNLGFGSTEFLVFRGKKEISDSDFIFYLSRSSFFRRFSEAKMIGTSGRQRVAKDAFENLVINLPSLQEQKSIASILSALDDKIELNLQMNKTLEEMAMALYKHWFVDFGPFQEGEFLDSELGEIPKGWEVRSIYSVADFINGAAFKPKDLLENNEEGLPVIKIVEIKQGITAQTKYSNKKLDEKYTISNGDILFPWSGNPHTSLGIHIWDKGDALLNQHIFVVRLEDITEKCFLFNLLKYQLPTFINLATHKQTTGLGHITVANLKELYIPYPNREVIEKYNKEGLPIFNLLYNNQLENISLTRLRDTLLPKLISGEVRVKDAEKTLSEVL